MKRGGDWERRAFLSDAYIQSEARAAGLDSRFVLVWTMLAVVLRSAARWNSKNRPTFLVRVLDFFFLIFG